MNIASTQVSLELCKEYVLRALKTLGNKYGSVFVSTWKTIQGHPSLFLKMFGQSNREGINKKRNSAVEN
jgi:hypothetical protein